jgi:hypothetical protein
MVALPLGLALATWVAYTFGLISKDDLLSMFINTGVGRYTRLVVATVVWALLTALIVHGLNVAGTTVLARRQRRRSAASISHTEPQTIAAPPMR